MHAIRFAAEPPFTPTWQEVPTPAPGPGQVRIRVHATALNRADLVQRSGNYPPPPGVTDVPGLEAAGVVDAVGAGVDGRLLGSRVCALLAGGGHAEQVVCPASHTLPIPEGMGFVEAAALPEVLTTAWVNLVHEAGARPGERVLLHAGASGVGTAALQIGRLMGWRTFVTVGSADKLARCVALGAEGGAVRHEGDWVDAVRAWAPEGVDVVLDPVGGGYLAADQKVLARGGRVVLIGLMGGRSETIDLGALLVKRQRLIGSVLRSRSDAEKTRILADLRDRLWPSVASGAVKPVIDRVVPIGEMDRAMGTLGGNGTVGKVVMTVG